MRLPIEINDEITLVLTHDELGYQPVLETLPQAKWVDVVTYNLSEGNEVLLNKLRELDSAVEVRIVTALPARWKFFKHDAHEAKKKFRKMLKDYSSFIDPKKFGPKTAGFFNVSNHSKVIMTDKLAYIGSANFSLESGNKFECGVLLSNLDTIEEIRETFVNHVIKHSESADLTPVSEAKVFLEAMRTKVRDLLIEHREGLYAPPDGAATGLSRFKWRDAEISSQFLEEFSDTLADVRDGANAGYEPAKLDDLMRSLDIPEIKQLIELVEDADNPLYRLACWKHSERYDRHWQKYVSEAYDDLLEVFQHQAQEDTDREYLELLTAAKKSHAFLWKTSETVFDRITAALKQLEEWEKTKWGVDNT